MWTAAISTSENIWNLHRSLQSFIHTKAISYEKRVINTFQTAWLCVLKWLVNWHNLQSHECMLPVTFQLNKKFIFPNEYFWENAHRLTRDNKFYRSNGDRCGLRRQCNYQNKPTSWKVIHSYITSITQT